MGRQADGKLAALAEARAVDGDAPAMHRDQTFDDGEAEAQA